MLRFTFRSFASTYSCILLAGGWTFSEHLTIRWTLGLIFSFFFFQWGKDNASLHPQSKSWVKQSATLHINVWLKVKKFYINAEKWADKMCFRCWTHKAMKWLYQFFARTLSPPYLLQMNSTQICVDALNSFHSKFIIANPFSVRCKRFIRFN